jgi:predicted dehydrogenase
MKKIKIGVLCPSEIAFRRFMPALKKLDGFEYIGIACANKDEWFGTPTSELLNAEKEKALRFKNEYGGKIFDSYDALLTCSEVDAVYIPLPPALHFAPALKALENGKHVLLEKPFTTSVDDTQKLISEAKKRNLALHENYMFAYHNQLDAINGLVKSGEIGDVRLIRIDFGFPFRGANDFRYNKALGGGALLDCGGYTVKLATMILGNSTRVTASNLCFKDGFDVDIYGNATLVNSTGLTAQLSFGMDNSYRCSLDVWGSTGSLHTGRILTAPDGFTPTATVKTANEERIINLPADDTFGKSILHFSECIENEDTRLSHYEDIRLQAELVQKIIDNN